MYSVSLCARRCAGQSPCAVTQATGSLGRGSGSRIPVTDEASEEHRFRVKAKVIGSECAARIRPQF